MVLNLDDQEDGIPSGRVQEQQVHEKAIILNFRIYEVYPHTHF